MGNFIGMVYATLKNEGIDTKGMSTDDAVKKYNELQGKSGKDGGEKEVEKTEEKGTPAEQKRMEEKGITESKDTKQSGLSKHLGVDVKKSEYDDNIYETEDGEEYYVGSYDEAYEYAKQDIQSLFDDMGMDSFTPDFQDWIYENAIDEDYFDNLLEEEKYYYTEEEPDEDMVNMIDGYEGNGRQYVEDNFGKEELQRMVKEHNLVDIDRVAKEAIDIDGIAHFIARYDGNEIDLGDGLYAYRQN